MILDEQVKPRWLLICSCGWERETVSDQAVAVLTG
jgi:hypothetical protein